MSRPPTGSAALAARLTWGALQSTALDADDRARLALGLGGVVLFERNVESPEQVRALTRSIRAAAAGPVRIAIDQEGGYVTRIGRPLTRFAGPMAIAATGSARLARAVATAAARELRALGIDTVLAPVLDVAAVLDNPSVGTRAFGDDRRLVARLGAAAVRGYLDGGVIPVPKHFPGHGRTALDSHVASPFVAGSVAELVDLDLPPFVAALRAGAPVLMTGHVAYEALADAQPASLSADATALARRGLGFDGLLLTDALVMDAITSHVTLEEAGVLAIGAGADAAMAIEGQRRVLEGLAAAIGEGRLSMARVEESLARADALERLAGSLADGAPAGLPIDDEAAVPAAYAAVAADVAARSITLVAADGRAPIIAAGPVLVLDVAGEARSPIEGRPRDGVGAGATLASRLPNARSVAVGPDDVAHVRGLIETVEAAAVVLLTRDAFARPGARAIVDAVGHGPVPGVHVALRNPLDLVLPGPATRVAAYADTPATIDALAACLAGRAGFRGRLPVRLPAHAPHPVESAA